MLRNQQFCGNFNAKNFPMCSFFIDLLPENYSIKFDFVAFN